MWQACCTRNPQDHTRYLEPQRPQRYLEPQRQYWYSKSRGPLGHKKKPHWRHHVKPEELLVIRTPGHLGQKIREGTEIKQQITHTKQRQTWEPIPRPIIIPNQDD